MYDSLLPCSIKSDMPGSLIMPIYEYESQKPDKGCKKCKGRFEIIQGIGEKSLTLCPVCGHKIKRIISSCRATIAETPDEYTNVEKKISNYEKQGMWSHAAELADKHSDRIKDKDMKLRSLDNYKKAGYDSSTLEKHLKAFDE